DGSSAFLTSGLAAHPKSAPRRKPGSTLQPSRKRTSGSRLSPGRRYYVRRSDRILTALIEVDRVGVTDEYDDHRHRGGGGVVIPDRVARRVLAGARRRRLQSGARPHPNPPPLAGGGVRRPRV